MKRNIITIVIALLLVAIGSILVAHADAYEPIDAYWSEDAVFIGDYSLTDESKYFSGFPAEIVIVYGAYCESRVDLVNKIQSNPYFYDTIPSDETNALLVEMTDGVGFTNTYYFKYLQSVPARSVPCPTGFFTFGELPTGQYLMLQAEECYVIKYGND